MILSLDQINISRSIIVIKLLNQVVADSFDKRNSQAIWRISSKKSINFCGGFYWKYFVLILADTISSKFAELGQDRKRL